MIACYFCGAFKPEADIWCHGFDQQTDPNAGPDRIGGALHRFILCERCRRLVELGDRERILWVIRSEAAQEAKEHQPLWGRWRNPDDVYHQYVRDVMYDGDEGRFVRTSGVDLAMRRFSAATGLLGPEAPYVTHLIDGAHRVYVEVMPTHDHFNFRVSEWPDGLQPVDVIEDRERCIVTFGDDSQATFDLDAEFERWHREHPADHRPDV